MKFANGLVLLSTLLLSLTAAAQIGRPAMAKAISDDYNGAPSKTFVTNASVDQLAREFDVEGGSKLNLNGEKCTVEIVQRGGTLTFEIISGGRRSQIQFAKSNGVQEIAVQGLENVSMSYSSVDNMGQTAITNSANPKLKVDRYEGLVDFTIESASGSSLCSTLAR